MSTASSMIDDLLAKVNALSTVPVKSTTTTGSFDAGWQPAVPRGHTGFSWRGDEEQPAVAAPKKKAQPAAAKAPAKQKPTTQPAAAATKSDKKDKKAKKAAKAAKPAASGDQPAIAQLEFKVGKIVECKLHPNADSMYIEQIDLGEGAPREIVSGLVGKVPMDKMLNAEVVVVSNLKPAKLRGVKSHGMVLCASAEDGKVDLLRPAAGSKVGERVFVKGMEAAFEQPAAARVDAKKKNSAWVQVCDDLRTDGNGVGTFKGAPLCTSAGECKSTLPNQLIK